MLVFGGFWWSLDVCWCLMVVGGLRCNGGGIPVVCWSLVVFGGIDVSGGFW